MESCSKALAHGSTLDDFAAIQRNFRQGGYLGAEFGSFDKWEQGFRSTSTALGGGSGWAILDFNFRDGKLHNYIAFDHTDNVAFGRPVLVNDMFEHSYHMDFGSNAAAYVDAFMQNVSWDEANRRLEEARKVFPSLRG